MRESVKNTKRGVNSKGQLTNGSEWESNNVLTLGRKVWNTNEEGKVNVSLCKCEEGH